MRLTVNGKPFEGDGLTTVDDLVRRFAAERRRRGTAVAVNGEVVPKSEWRNAALAEDDRVEILHAVGGG